MTKSELRDLWWGMANEDPSRVKEARVLWDSLGLSPDSISRRASESGLSFVELGKLITKETTQASRGRSA